MDRRRQNRPQARSLGRHARQRPVRRPVQRRTRKSRIRRARRDYTLLALDFFVRIVRSIKAGYQRTRKLRHFRALSTFAAIVFIISVGTIIFHAASRPNALEIYLDETQIGVVRLEGNREITLDYITRHAMARLGGRLDGSRVQLTGEIRANPVRLSVGAPSLTFDNLISGLVDVLDYYVYGAAILVDGAEVALLPSVVAAENALNSFAYSFRVNTDAAFSHQFLQEVTVARRYVHDTELMMAEEAVNALGSTQSTPEIYTVQSGDTFLQIAVNMRMTPTALSARNPNINPDVLFVGQTLFVVRTAPILNVMTIETYGNEIITRINGVVQ